MAVRAPLYLDGSNNLVEMTSGEVDAWEQYMCYLYGASPSVTLAVQSSGGDLGTINDTRLQAGAQSTSATATPSEGTTAEPSTVTVGYSRVELSLASVSPTADSGTTFPVYYTGSDVQAMSLQDVKDTFLILLLTDLYLVQKVMIPLEHIQLQLVLLLQLVIQMFLQHQYS